jgi:Protein of unknown function (DUF3253)
MTEAAMEPARIEAAIVALVQQRGTAASACPSDVARALSPDHWRALMPQVREAASRLAQRGTIEIAQRGQAVSPAGPWKGPIRLRLPRAD